MGTYNAVTFQEILDQDVYRLHWAQENNVSIRHIPYSNQDDVQFGGRGSFTVTVEVLLLADADLTALQAIQGDGTARSLTLYSTVYANSYLMRVGDARRFDAQAAWRVALSFLRAGT